MLSEDYKAGSVDSHPSEASSDGPSVHNAKPMRFRHHTAFVIQSDKCLSRDQAAHLREEWRRAWLASGAANPPGLLILEPGFKIYEMAGLTQA